METGVDQKPITLAALGAALLAVPAQAAPVSNSDGTARVRILEPLAIFKVDDLDFGTIVTDPALPGVVTMPSDGSARVTAQVVGVPGDPGNRGRFTVVGDPGREIIVTHSTPPQLVSTAGDTIPVMSLVLNGSPLRTLNSVDGVEQLYFGGSLWIAADQAEGLYEANFTVTVDYR